MTGAGPQYPEGTTTVGTRPLVLTIAACLGFAFAARLLAPPPGAEAWYMELERPGFAAPAVIVLLVGAFYYLVFGTILYRAQVHIAPPEERRTAIGLVLAVLAFNAVWNGLFIRLESPGAGVLGTLAMAGLLGALALVLRRHDRTSLLFLAPYLAWVAWDLVWGISIWRLNS